MKRLCTPSQTCSVILQVELGNLSTSLYKAGSHWINCWQKHWRITMKSTRSWTLCFLTTPCNMCKLKKPISLVVFFKGTFSVWQVRVHSGMKVNYFPAFYSHMVGLPSISSVSWRLPPLISVLIYPISCPCHISGDKQLPFLRRLSIVGLSLASRHILALKVLLPDLQWSRCSIL